TVSPGFLVNVNWLQFAVTAAATPTSTASRTSTSTPNPSSGANAYATIQAESFTAKSAGAQTEPAGDVGGGLDVGYIHNADWLQFDNVNFGTTTANQFIARVASAAGAGVTGQIEVRLDNLANSPIGSIPVADTGGWQTWQTRSTTI